MSVRISAGLGVTRVLPRFLRLNETCVHRFGLKNHMPLGMNNYVRRPSFPYLQSVGMFWPT